MICYRIYDSTPVLHLNFMIVTYSLEGWRYRLKVMSKMEPPKKRIGSFFAFLFPIPKPEINLNRYFQLDPLCMIDTSSAQCHTLAQLNEKIIFSFPIILCVTRARIRVSIFNSSDKNIEKFIIRVSLWL